MSVMEILSAVGISVKKFFKWRERKDKRAMNDLQKNGLVGTDSNKLSKLFNRVFGRRKKD